MSDNSNNIFLGQTYSNGTFVPSAVVKKDATIELTAKNIGQELQFKIKTTPPPENVVILLKNRTFMLISDTNSYTISLAVALWDKSFEIKATPGRKRPINDGSNLGDNLYWGATHGQILGTF